MSAVSVKGAHRRPPSLPPLSAPRPSDPLWSDPHCDWRPPASPTFDHGYVALSNLSSARGWGPFVERCHIPHSPPAATKVRLTASIVSRNCSVGVNSTTSVRAKILGVCRGRSLRPHPRQPPPPLGPRSGTPPPLEYVARAGGLAPGVAREPDGRSPRRRWIPLGSGSDWGDLP